MSLKNKYRNESIRIKNYDYSQKGLYFITICTQHRESKFGYIDDGKMILNDAGIMLGKWYFEMGNKYPNIHCGEYITMPNHFHCIIEIIDNMNTNKFNTVIHDRNRIISNVNPDAHERMDDERMDAHVGVPLRGRPSPEKRVVSGLRGRPSPEKRVVNSYGQNNKKYNATIPLMVNWFKTMTTNEYIRGVKNYNWPRYDRKLWQQNYWDHIIHSENELIRIKKYIKNNPGKWDKSKF